MQEDTGGRTAFTFTPLLKHRTTDAARRITSLALDTSAGRIFLGLASGHIEEHQISLRQPHVGDAGSYYGAIAGGGAGGTGHVSSASYTRLVAEKRVSKQAVKTLACMPTAARLAILCEDGTASVAAYDSWALTPLPGVRSATAMAADPGPAAAATAAAAAAAASSAAASRQRLTSAATGGKPPPLPVTAAAGPPAPRPTRLAVAVKSITAPATLLVYSVAPSVGEFASAEKQAVTLLAQVTLTEVASAVVWVGSGLFLQTATSYSLLQPGGRYSLIAEHNCRRPRMASAPWGTGPGSSSSSIATATANATAKAGAGATAASAAAAAQGALLFADSLVLLTDGSGVAVPGSEPIVLGGGGGGGGGAAGPEAPLALATSGPFLVAVTDGDGLLVYDRSSSALVQRIFWAHDDPWVTAAGQLPAAEDAAGGGAVAVATSAAVLVLQPVAADVQARELLKRKRFDAALALIRACRRAGEDWADVALAQAGLLMMQELRCEDALAALEEVGPDTFQPAQLMPLFPQVCGRWLAAVPQRHYWGLHGHHHLHSLDRLCEDFLELRDSTAGSSPRTTHAAPSPVAPSPPASLHRGTAPGHQHHQHQHHHGTVHQQQHGALVAAAAAQAVAAAGGGGGEGGGPGAGAELAALAADAKRHIAAYLTRARQLPGVVLLEGLDTLLAHLLIDTGDTAALEAFLSSATGATPATAATATATAATAAAAGTGPAVPATAAGAATAATTAGRAVPGRLQSLGTAIVAPAADAAAPAAAPPPTHVSARDAALVAALQGAGRWHALALLRAARGSTAQALELWQRLSLGEVAESRTASGAVAAAAAAAAAALEAGEPAAQTAAPAAGGEGGGGGGGGSPGRGEVYGRCWAAAAAAVAAAAAAALMAAPERTPPLLCLSKLPWLLSAAPDRALHVLRSRALPVAEVLALLQGRADGVRWQYLHHLVYSPPQQQQQQQQQQQLQPVRRVQSGGSVGSGVLVELGEGGGGGGGEDATAGEGGSGSSAAAAAEAAPPAWHLDPSLHTELALELVECIAGLLQLLQPQLQPQLQPPSVGQQAGAPSSAAGGASGGGSSSPFQQAAAQDAAAAALSAWQQPLELQPPLPPLPGGRGLAAPGASGHSGDVTAAAAAAAVAAARSPVRGHQHAHHVHAHAHAHAHGHHAAQLHVHAAIGHSPHRTAHTAAHTPGRPHGGTDTPAGAAAAAAASNALPSLGSGRLSGGGAAAGAAAGGSNSTSSTPATSELAWLATIGAMPAAAAARQLALAVRAAVIAGGGSPDPPSVPTTSTATATASRSAVTTAAAAGGASGSSGCSGGDSLALLRALSAGGDGVGIGGVMGLRAVLQHHLYESGLYDADLVLQALRGAGAADPGVGASAGAGAVSLVHVGSTAASQLQREAVQLAARLGDHAAALAGLALQLRDVDSAICYCRARCGEEGWFTLLDLLLRPPPGTPARQPDYVSACRVLAAEGAALAPLRVLAALGDDMPLHLAADTLARMVGSVQHRRRQGQVLRALHRAQNLALRAELAHLQTSRVVVAEETVCRGCQRPLGAKVFYRFPSGVVMCARCARPDGEMQPAPPPPPPGGSRAAANGGRATADLQLDWG